MSSFVWKARRSTAPYETIRTPVPTVGILAPPPAASCYDGAVRLRKRDVEALWSTYDADPRAALGAALRLVRDRPGASFGELVADLPDAAALLSGTPEALDALARRLAEDRTL
jgi:hypothetical protein